MSDLLVFICTFGPLVCKRRLQPTSNKNVPIIYIYIYYFKLVYITYNLAFKIIKVKAEPNTLQNWIEYYIKKYAETLFLSSIKIKLFNIWHPFSLTVFSLVWFSLKSVHIDLYRTSHIDVNINEKYSFKIKPVLFYWDRFF